MNFKLFMCTYTQIALQWKHEVNTKTTTTAATASAADTAVVAMDPHVASYPATMSI